MASIRTVKFGAAKFEWNTGKLSDIPFIHSNIEKWHMLFIRPRLKVKSRFEIRRKVFSIIEEAISKQYVKTMTDLTNILMAARMTLVDENVINDDGYLKVVFVVPNNEARERITFYNIMWHINHHCRQLYKFCFVMVRLESTNEEMSIAYTGGEWLDHKGDDFDNRRLKDTNYRKYKRDYAILN